MQTLDAGAALFVDGTAAFASMIRRFVVPVDGYRSDEELARTLVSAGRTPAEADVSIDKDVSYFPSIRLYRI